MPRQIARTTRALRHTWRAVAGWCDAHLVAIVTSVLLCAIWLGIAPAIASLIQHYADAAPADQAALLAVGGTVLIALTRITAIRRITARRRRQGPALAAIPTARLLSARTHRHAELEGIPAPLRTVWLGLCGLYGEPYATWVIANVDDDATPEKVLAYAEDRHHHWVEGTYRARGRESFARHEAAHAVVGHVIGCTVLQADIRATETTGGQTHSILPVPFPAEHDAAWIRMRSGLAGRAIDILSGQHDHGSTNDVESATKDAAIIVSTGLRPTGYTGPLTTDSLLAAASSEARRILLAHQDVVDAIASALMEKEVLGSHDLRALLPATTDDVVVPGRASFATRAAAAGQVDINEAWRAMAGPAQSEDPVVQVAFRRAHAAAPAAARKADS
ncbi:hypothetical protein [Isoptericola sp. NPDC056605]|uniref:hypothetical protein n=1 Tax=Isoptericola sp. NPDC056605 TaxID=3345876 RepID=UPI0036C999EE